MAIAFVGAGTGVERLTAGTVNCSKSVTSGNFLIFQSFFGGDTGDGGFTNFSGVEALDGVDNSMTSLINAANRQVLVGRAIASTASADLLIGASGDDGAARIYEFSGVSLGTTIETVCENGASTNTEVGFTTSTTVADADVTTIGSSRLALNFVNLRTSQALGNFTGETGGDWTETVAEFSGTTLTIQLQTAAMPTAGVIDGGTMTVSSTFWITIGTALIPSLSVVASSDDPPIGVLGRGAGW